MEEKEPGLLVENGHSVFFDYRNERRQESKLSGHMTYMKLAEYLAVAELPDDAETASPVATGKLIQMELASFMAQQRLPQRKNSYEPAA